MSSRRYFRFIFLFFNSFQFLSHLTPGFKFLYSFEGFQLVLCVCVHYCFPSISDKKYLNSKFKENPTRLASTVILVPKLPQHVHPFNCKLLILFCKYTEVEIKQKISCMKVRLTINHRHFRFYRGSFHQRWHDQGQVLNEFLAKNLANPGPC